MPDRNVGDAVLNSTGSKVGGVDFNRLLLYGRGVKPTMYMTPHKTSVGGVLEAESKILVVSISVLG